MSPLEWIAVLLTVAGVWLTARQHLLCWPVGLASVALYAWIFFAAKLYSDALLQACFLVLQLYGWWAWLQESGAAHRAASRGPRRHRATGGLVLRGRPGSAAWGWLMATQTDAAYPYTDAVVLIFSLICQYWMARKILECWIGWLLIDILATWIYAGKDLAPDRRPLRGPLRPRRQGLVRPAPDAPRPHSGRMMPLRFCIFGAESTGKSTLAESLARHFHSPWVAEYARAHCDLRGGVLGLEDAPLIAAGQEAAEEAAAATLKTGALLFCDTDVLSSVIWCDLLYGGCRTRCAPAPSSAPAATPSICCARPTFPSSPIRSAAFPIPRSAPAPRPAGRTCWCGTACPSCASAGPTGTAGSNRRSARWSNGGCARRTAPDKRSGDRKRNAEKVPVTGTRPLNAA
ncbi:MAG: nicotinamide riboside transporter PnuC [Kiritimatiellia bacterium]